MNILSIGKEIEHKDLDIKTVPLSKLSAYDTLDNYQYIIISGGDGTIRRVLKEIHQHKHIPTIIINPIGSFNVVAKLHKVDKLTHTLDKLANNDELYTSRQQIYTLNDEVFLFSAGNMGDLQHIMISETLRFGVLKQGPLKYALALFFLFPLHIVSTPFSLLSSKKFFIFTPLKFINKFGSFHGKVKKMEIDLVDGHNIVELDGDVVAIQDALLKIELGPNINILSKKKG